MTRLSDLHGGVNLSQGFPDFPAPESVKAAAIAAIQDDVNQYSVTWGARPLREAVAREFTRRYGLDVVPDEQVTVCCGSTEAMMSTMMAVIDPGDEVVVFEPFYENYGPDAILSGATPRYVTLYEPDASAPSTRPRRTGTSIPTSWRRPSTIEPKPSLSTPRTIRRARSLLEPNSKRSPPYAASGMRSPSQTRSTSTSSTTVTGTCRSRPSRGWRIAPSRSTGCPRPTA